MMTLVFKIAFTIKRYKTLKGFNEIVDRHFLVIFVVHVICLKKIIDVLTVASIFYIK